MTQSTPVELISRAARLAAPIYRANGWMWGKHSDADAHVPDETEIAETITRLTERVLSGEARSSSSGRLTVEADPDDGEVSVYVELVCLRDGHDDWPRSLQGTLA